MKTRKGRKESEIQDAIRVALSRGPVRLFRQNVGTGWTGDVQRMRDGSLVIRNPRPLHAGFKGLSDLGGWVTVEVTPEMVGRKIAVYAAVEVKTATGRVREEQSDFLAIVQQAGGAAGVARSVADAAAIVRSAGGTVIPDDGVVNSDDEGEDSSPPTTEMGE